eukprot:10718141-Ditylum_brightwellii.AAC.1
MLQERRKELLQCMVDILALPTTPCTSGEDTQLDLAHIAGLTQAVVTMSNGVPINVAPNISGIQNQAKTALDKICTKEELIQYYKVPAMAQHEAMDQKGAFQQAQFCLLYCIMRG